jgi:tetratricopeptide (TPR) repeat protein
MEKVQLEEGLAAYQKSIQLARRANRADQLAQSLVLLAEAFVTCGRPEEAIPNFEEAVGVLRRLGNEKSLAAALAQLATAQQSAGLVEAEVSWRQAAEMQERLGNHLGAMVALERLASLRRVADRSEAEGKVYCEYLAPNPAAILEHAARVGIPADKISEVSMEIDPSMFR